MMMRRAPKRSTSEPMKGAAMVTAAVTRRRPVKVWDGVQPNSAWRGPRKMEKVAVMTLASPQARPSPQATATYQP